MTPFRSRSVCQAKMRSREFIHIGMMKMVVMIAEAPLFIRDRIIASG